MPDLASSPAATDHLGLSRYGPAITERSRVLLICGPSEAVLQQHARQLLSWLRQARPGLQVEQVPQLEGDQLIQRFNEMLAGLSIEAAVRPEQPAPPERLWILRDEGQYEEAQVRLLAKLQHQFPAARLSTVMLTSQGHRFSALLASQERGILHWRLPGEAMDGAPGGEPPFSPALTPPTPWPASTTAAPQRPAVSQQAPTQAKAQMRPPQTRGRLAKTLTGAVLGFATSTTLVVGGVLWLHGQGRLGDIRSWLGVQQAAQPQAARPITPAGGTSAVPATPVTSGASEPAAESERQALSSSDDPKTPPTGDTPAPADQGDGRAGTQADPRVLPPIPAVVREGQRWAGKLPADNYLVIHGRFDSVSQAEQFTKRHAYLQNARMLAADPKPASQVLLVTGPFQSEQRAQSYIARLELKEAAALKVADLQRR